MQTRKGERPQRTGVHQGLMGRNRGMEPRQQYELIARKDRTGITINYHRCDDVGRCGAMDPVSAAGACGSAMSAIIGSFLTMGVPSKQAPSSIASIFGM